MKVIRKNLCEIFPHTCQDSNGMRESHFCRRDFAFFFLRAFACVSPVFAGALFAASLFTIAPVSSASNSPSNTAAADPTAAIKRQAASSQFARAEEQRGALNSKSAEKRTLADLKHVDDS